MSTDANLTVGIVFLLIAPIASCFVVINGLVGVENLKRHYWFTDGVAISAVLSVIVLAPLVHPKVWKVAPTYTTVAATLVFVFVLSIYGYWMGALMGV